MEDKCAEVRAFDDLMDHVLRTAGRYNKVKELLEVLPESFFQDIDPDALVEWARLGLDARPLELASGETDRVRDAYFTALDVAVVASEVQNETTGTKDRQWYLRNSPLASYIRTTDEQVLGALLASPPTDGVLIYRLYNEGTVLRSPDTCMGIDIVLDPLSNELAEGFASVLDALLITHGDDDHLDRRSRLHELMKERGKPVIYIEDDTTVSFGDLLTAGSIGAAEWKAFRGGHLNLRFSSFLLISLNGQRILHSGDNTVWLPFAESEYASDIDLFLLKPESVFLRSKDEIRSRKEFDIQEAMEASLHKLRPRLVVPHHMLELGHGLNAYGHDLAFRIREKVAAKTRVCVVSWGEAVELE